MNEHSEIYRKYSGSDAGATLQPPLMQHKLLAIGMNNEPPNEPSIKDRSIQLSTIVGVLGMYGLPSDFLGSIRHSSQPPVRPCLHCGKPKQHNNAFCSAECCREHKKTPQGSKHDDAQKTD